MALIERDRIDRYRATQAAVLDAAVTDLEALWQQVQDLDLDAMREALTDGVGIIIDRYGTVAAGVAADWFEELTGLNGFVPDLYDPDTWAASTRWALGPAFRSDGALSQVLVNLVAVSGRHIANHGRRVLDESVTRSPDVRWARVPKGPTCEFCTVLASRGPVYGSRESASIAGSGARAGLRFHDHDDCEAVPMRGEWVVDRGSERGIRWEGDRVAGYDHERLYAAHYKPFHEDGDLISQVTARMRAAAK